MYLHCALFALQVVLLCWENHLYDAMIYVYNSGMNDFISPMEVAKMLSAVSCYLCVQRTVFLRNSVSNPMHYLLIQCVHVLLFHFTGEIVYEICSLFD